MEIIGTLPPPHQFDQLRRVAEHPLIDSARFNIGARTPDSPKVTLEKLLKVMDGKKFWLDIKGRQLRITKWADQRFGDIELNHPIRVQLPATIYFRGNQSSIITAITDNKIYVDPDPPSALGAGQAINIIGEGLEIDGYFTEEDLQYIEAAKELNIHNYMLSFVEKESDIADLVQLDPLANIVAKIESPKGMQFVTDIFPHYKGKIQLMAARDDLFINIGQNKLDILPALKTIITQDENAIVASRIATSFEKDAVVSLGDISDMKLMQEWGYKSFMLSDGICAKKEPFLDAMMLLSNFKRQYGEIAE